MCIKTDHKLLKQGRDSHPPSLPPQPRYQNFYPLGSLRLFQFYWPRILNHRPSHNCPLTLQDCLHAWNPQHINSPGGLHLAASEAPIHCLLPRAQNKGHLGPRARVNLSLGNVCFCPELDDLYRRGSTKSPGASHLDNLPEQQVTCLHSPSGHGQSIHGYVVWGG